MAAVRRLRTRTAGHELAAEQQSHGRIKKKTLLRLVADQSGDDERAAEATWLAAKAAAKVGGPKGRWQRQSAA